MNHPWKKGDRPWMAALCWRDLEVQQVELKSVTDKGLRVTERVAVNGFRIEVRADQLHATRDEALDTLERGIEAALAEANREYGAQLKLVRGARS